MAGTFRPDPAPPLRNRVRTGPDEKDQRMPKSSRFIIALCVVGFAAACAPKKEEVVYVDQGAVSTEPTYTGKYK